MQFIKRQLKQIQQGGSTVLLRQISKMPRYIFAIPVVLIMRLIKPWLLVRLSRLNSLRIGHFVGNTEMYLCERDAGINVPNQRHIDIFYLEEPICNQQLVIMWQRVLRIWPAWVVAPTVVINQLIPGGESHEIGNSTSGDRDVHNLFERFPSHLKFTAEEEMGGEASLRAMGLPDGAQFICLIVRDSAYLDSQHPTIDWSYHNYRDSDIQNYILAAEELADRGYFVFRMGAKVHSSINSAHPKVIDYASNGMRSDFMDIYLGTKCAFCLTVGTGFDCVPLIARRPIVEVNNAPLGSCITWGNTSLLLSKHHIDMKSGHELTAGEIFLRDIGFCSNSLEYKSKGISLIENTPEEIRDVAIEMAERLVGTWQEHPDDEAMQQRFWEIFPTDAVDPLNGRLLHGKIRTRFSAAFLRNNSEWLQ